MGIMGIRILITILILLAVLYIGLLYILYRRAVGCTEKQKQQPIRLPKSEDYIPWHGQMKALVAEMEQQPFETVEIRSRDGLLLRARYLHVRDGSPYTSPEEIVRVVIRKNHLPDKIFFPLVNQGARLFGHVNLRGADVRQAIKKTPVPILLIHGTGDDFVPYEMSLKLRDANPEKVRLHTTEGAPHGISYMVDTPAYEQAALAFISAALE